MIKIYHYSNQDFKGYIKPRFFGGNLYTSYSAKISKIKRSYFYSDISSFSIETRFLSNRFIYHSKINEKYLYNLTVEEKQNDIYAWAKRNKYIGIKKDNIVVLFYPAKIIKKELND
jgi:hypothetical protein